MRLVSHRGNLEGPQPSMENHPDYIDNALKYGRVEVDLRIIDGRYYLGHDEPQYEIPLSFLLDRKYHLYVHCKTLETISYLSKYEVKETRVLQLYDLNCFWHENDKMTMTSHGDVWCYPGYYIPNGITVLFGNTITKENFNIARNICTDYPLNIRIV